MNGWGIRLHTSKGALWWRPDAQGYSDRIEDAGVFCEELARRQDGQNRMNPGSDRDEAVYPGDFAQMVEDEIYLLESRLERLRDLQQRIGGES
jgi:hypothetical protein